MTGMRRGPERLQSKRHTQVNYKCKIAANDSGELSGCMRIYPISPPDQSVSRKVGLELSYPRRMGEVMK